MRPVLLISSTVIVLSIFASTAFARAPQVVSAVPDQNELNVAVSANITVTFDIDMDGDLDPAADDGSGTFAPHYTNPAGTAPGAIFASDLDGDGDLDLATASGASDSVSILLNENAGCEYVVGDVNGSCSYNGLDITYGVNYFKGGAGPIPCADCPSLETIAVLESISRTR